MLRPRGQIGLKAKLVDHVIREFAATVKHVQKLQNLITLNIINMKNSSYTTVVNNY